MTEGRGGQGEMEFRVVTLVCPISRKGLQSRNNGVGNNSKHSACECDSLTTNSDDRGCRGRSEVGKLGETTNRGERDRL